MSGSTGGSKIWLLILLLPFFAAIAHDFTMSRALNPARTMRLEAFDIDPEAYQASDFGYIVVKYTPSLYDQLKGMVSAMTWTRWIDPVLRVYTFIVALLPAGLYFIWLVVSWAVDSVLSVAMRGRSVRGVKGTASDSDYSVRRMLGDNSGTNFKFKRR